MSDNASQDGTEEMMAELVGAAAIHISYSRAPGDAGFGPNLMRAVELSRGRWCWLLSSDDAVAPGGVVRVLELLEHDPRVAGITVNRAAYDTELRTELLEEPSPSIVPRVAAGATTLSSTSLIFEQIGVLLGYMSSQIVNHAVWSDAARRLGHDAVARARSFPHVAVVGAMLATCPDWIWCPEALVRQRTGTPVLSDGGSVARHMVDISADLSHVLGNVPGLGTPTRRELLERWRRAVAVPTTIAWIRRTPGYRRSDDIRLLIGYGRTFWRLSGFWRETAPALLGLARARAA